MRTVMRIAGLVVGLAMLSSCAHSGTLGIPSPNTIIISKLGIPQFAGQPNRCPAQIGEGGVDRVVQRSSAARRPTARAS
jgi:hypothetical protein